MSAKKQIIYIDMDKTLCDYRAGFSTHKEKHPKEVFPQSIPGLYLSLPPLPDAIETYQWLDEQEKFEVYILTAPSVRNPHCYSEKRLWVERYLGINAAYKLIISPNKGLNKGDFLIDDNVSGKGQEDFEGVLIQYGSKDFPNWQRIKDYFCKYTLCM